MEIYYNGQPNFQSYTKYLQISYYNLLKHQDWDAESMEI